MAATASHLTAMGVPVISTGRQGSSSINEYSVLTLERLLDRLENQLKEGSQAKTTNTWQAAGIAIALTHAQTIISELQAQQGLSSTVASMRSRLQRATQSYVQLYPLEQQQTQPRTMQRQFSGSFQTQMQPVQVADTRSFLLQDDLLEDSDDDSEFEDNALDEELHRDVKDEDNVALGGIKPDEKVESEELGEKNVDDGMDEYEAAASLRRRKNANTQDSLTRVSNTENEKEAQEDAPPTALQSERSVQDSLSGELLRMAGILKANSMKFADALERDRKILEQADEKLQGNLTLMTRTRGKLGDYSRKARGMGWITLGAIAMVCSSWIVMFLLIRLT
ncbi:uncharacterized protein FA14DRAFT_161666 [Meira miltonrushii]|uniref:t-SNARE coiled-coil homology domain-containing protein n=1 Tax=Meira miltonrushii TaxID=1280837 RepID=A0A316VDU0_9BASI|nr:uncharacterized protein FA14DRAFT_161666 [Meira miltonrushii]PWN34171.1 hypothetical protein FA14DRAFT_161666 [Meira miltonrushii]